MQLLGVCCAECWRRHPVLITSSAGTPHSSPVHHPEKALLAYLAYLVPYLAYLVPYLAYLALTWPLPGGRALHLTWPYLALPLCWPTLAGPLVGSEI